METFTCEGSKSGVKRRIKDRVNEEYIRYQDSNPMMGL